MTTDPTNRPTEESAQPKKAGLRKGLQITWLEREPSGDFVSRLVTSPDDIYEDLAALRWLADNVMTKPLLGLSGLGVAVMVCETADWQGARCYLVSGSGADFKAELEQ